MHVKLKMKINIVVYRLFDMDVPPPISKDFDSQGMAASRAAHFPHLLRASRQMTAAARHNAACRRVFCALAVSTKTNHVDITYNDNIVLECKQKNETCCNDTCCTIHVCLSTSQIVMPLFLHIIETIAIAIGRWEDVILWCRTTVSVCGLCQHQNFINTGLNRSDVRLFVKWWYQYLVPRLTHLSNQNQNQNQKCFYSILTKSIYKVTMKRIWIRGPLLRPAWSLT